MFEIDEHQCVFEITFIKLHKRKMFLQKNFQALQEFFPSSYTQTSIECIWSVRHEAGIHSLIDTINKMVLSILKFLDKAIGQVTAKHSSKHQAQCFGENIIKTHEEIDICEIF